MLWLAGDVKQNPHAYRLAFVVILKVGWEMLSDISYDKATLQSEGK